MTEMEEGDTLKINSQEIRRLRIIKNLSIRQLSDLSGVSKSQISDLENRQLKNTTLDTICRLAIALEVEVTDLFGC